MKTRIDSGRARAPWWPTALGLVLLVAGVAVSFGRSLSRGRAGAEMTYDDVVYALAGNNNASILLDSGGRAMLADLVHNPPHGPVNQALAAVAALLGGPSTVRVYLVSAITVTALTVALAHLVLRGRWALAFGAAGIALASPFGFVAIDTFRPEVFYVLVLAVLTALCARFALRPPGSDHQQALALGVGTAALLYAKPTFVLVTAGSAAALAVWCLIVMRPAAQAARTRFVFLLRTAGWFAVASLPFWVLLLRRTVDYVIENTIGGNASVWTVPDPWYAMRTSMTQASDSGGWPVRAAILLGVLAVVTALVSRRPRWLLRASAFLLVGLVGMGMVAIARQTNAFFGLVPVVLLLLACVVAGADVTRGLLATPRGCRARSSARGWTQTPVTAAVVVVGVGAALLLVGYGGPTTMPASDGIRPPLSLNSRVLTAIVDDCAARPTCDGAHLSQRALPPTLVPFAAEVNSDALRWQAVLAGWQPAFAVVDIQADLTEMVDALGPVEYAVTLGPAATSVNAALPMNLVQAELAAHLQASPTWREVPLPVTADRYRLFARVAP